MTRPLRVLVVCSGNIGRSPLAAALLRSALAERMGVDPDDLESAGVEVTSAGINAPQGHGASKRGMAFAAGRGIDLSAHSSTLLTAELADGADVIYGFDTSHIGGVGALSTQAVAKTVLWEGPGLEIPDPHHESDQFFVAVGERIEAALTAVLDDVLAMLERRRRS